MLPDKVKCVGSTIYPIKSIYDQTLYICDKIILYKTANKYRVEKCKNLNANIVFTDPDKAFNNVYKNMSPGSSEEQLAWLFEKSVREIGGEAISFDTIVASGSNGARPHHRAGSDLLKEREPIVIDCGARFEGYCSDLTRTVVMGHPDKFTKNIGFIKKNALKYNQLN